MALGSPGTFSSRADNGGVGERSVLVTPDGKPEFFLRDCATPDRLGWVDTKKGTLAVPFLAFVGF